MIGIISDVHANLAALEAVLARLDAMGAARIVCLGDVGGYHSQVNECCELIRQRCLLCLQGNHDAYLATGAACPRSRSANRCLDYQRGILDEDHRRWLASLLPAARIGDLDLVHGGWHDRLDEYVEPTEAYFAALDGSRFASGHTHVPCLWRSAGKVYCNPGSVGQPRDGDPRAAFAVFDGGEFSLHRVAYDVAATQAAMHAAGFEPYFYQNLSAGTRIGGKVDAR
ncbi:MAG: metallophosphoesterase family protein [Rhodocyclaceae bacterium]|nr:metallophosphoesterase family protein [Rhodocyclaceae bacterium]